MIKTLIFDLGNVIVPFDIARELKGMELFCDHSSNVIKDKIFSSPAVVDFEKGLISSTDFFDSIETLLGLRMNFEQFKRAWNSIFSLEPILSEQLIKRLSEDYRMIILSDTNEIHFEFINEKFQILQIFDAFVLSFEHGCTKPSDEIFSVAVNAAKCRPEECFFVDDKPGNISGAQQFGINAIEFTSANKFEQDLKTLGILNHY